MSNDIKISKINKVTGKLSKDVINFDQKKNEEIFATKNNVSENNIINLKNEQINEFKAISNTNEKSKKIIIFYSFLFTLKIHYFYI